MKMGFTLWWESTAPITWLEHWLRLILKHPLSGLVKNLARSHLRYAHLSSRRLSKRGAKSTLDSFAMTPDRIFIRKAYRYGVEAKGS